MRRFLVLVVLVGMLTALFAVGAVGQVTNEHYTGCLTAGGDLTNIGMGDFPAKPCNKNSQEVTVVGPGDLLAVESLILDEEAARGAADTALSDRIDDLEADLAAEVAARLAADAALDERIDTEGGLRILGDNQVRQFALDKVLEETSGRIRYDGILLDRITPLETLLAGVERNPYMSRPGEAVFSLYFPGVIIGDGIRSYGCIDANGTASEKLYCTGETWHPVYGSSFIARTPDGGVVFPPD